MSKEVLKLSKPLLVNGKSLRELNYTLDLDVDDILIAHENRAKAHNNMDASMKLVEFDTELHLYAGMQAIIKLNPEIDIADLKRLSGSDVPNLFRIGRTFFTQTASEESSKISKEPSAPIQEDTTVQS